MVNPAQAMAVMAKCLFFDEPDPRVTVGELVVSGMKFAEANVQDLGSVRIVQQNPRTASPYAKWAKSGVPIGWVFYTIGGYVGYGAVAKDDTVYVAPREHFFSLVQDLYGPPPS